MNSVIRFATMRTHPTAAARMALMAICSFLLVISTNGQTPQPRRKADAVVRKFEANARTLTIFDRAGHELRTLGARAIYNQPVFSPDGKRVAVAKVDLTPASCPDGTRCPTDIWIFDVGTGNETRITSSRGSDRVVQEFVWSPDGSQLVYCALRGNSAALYRKAANGEGAEELLYQNPAGTQVVPLNWGSDGRLSFFTPGGGLSQMFPMGDRKPAQLLSSTDFTQTGVVLGARVSPDDRLIAYQVTESSKNEIYIRTLLPGGTKSRVSDAGLGMIRWREDGRELYYMAPDRTVMAVEVDAAAQVKLSAPKPLFKELQVLPNTDAYYPFENPWGLGSVSPDGRRVVFAVPPRVEFQQVRIVDRKGKTITKVGEPGLYQQVSLSPDGARLSIVRTVPNTGKMEVVSFDLATGKVASVTNDSKDHPSAIWSSDFTHILYVTFPIGGTPPAIYRKPWTGTGVEELIYQFSEWAPINLTDISRDGKFLTYSSGGVIFVLPLAEGTGHQPIEFEKAAYETDFGRFSPDSRFLAFVSNETNRDEIYVRPFSTPVAAGPKWQASKDGGTGVASWREDGKELYYLNNTPARNEMQVMAAAVTLSPSFSSRPAELLFRVPGRNLKSNFSVNRDGTQFVLLLPENASLIPR
jgi:Tol biopolymer transport system component